MSLAGEQASDPVLVGPRRRTEAVVAWLIAAVALSAVWLVVLVISFPVLRPTGGADRDDAAVCGTVLRPHDEIPGCAPEVAEQRWFLAALVVVALASIGVSCRYGPRAMRDAKWTSTMAVAFCFTLASPAMTGVIAVSSHYGRFSYGDSAWTDALSFNSLHETAYVLGIVVLIFTLPTGFILGIGRLLFPRSTV